MTDEKRYALEHPDRGRFCPEVGTIIGFPSAVAAMRHIFDVLPHEAHEWSWVPVEQPAPSSNPDRKERT